MNRIACLLFTYLLLFCAGSSQAQKQGQAYIDSMQSVLALLGADSNKVRMLNDLSEAYANNHPDSGIYYGGISLELAQRINYKRGIAWAHNSLALNYMSRSDYPGALEHYFLALKLHEVRNDKIAVSIVSGNIGSVFYVQQNSVKALEFYNKALQAARETDYKGEEMVDLGGIGNVYDQTGDFPKAVEYTKAAIAVAKEMNDSTNVARNLGNLANVYSAQRDYNRSLKSNLEALAIAEKIRIQTIRAIDYGNIGETYLAIAKDTAFRPAGSTIIPAGKEANLALAIDYLKKGVAACGAIRYLAPMSEFSQQLSEAYALTGNYKDALGTYQQYVTTKDSVFSASNREKITKLETQRAIDLKNKQIELDRLAVQKKRNERGFFIVGLGLLMAVVVVVFRNYRVQKDLNGRLFVEKKKVERRTEELDVTNKELTNTLADLKETQQQLIVVEKQKENEMIRSRISQDIHDDISSELTRISWVSELAKAKVKKADYSTMPDLLEKITGSSRETVTKLGEIIWTVNPANDSLASLLAYMRAHITKFFADTDFNCHVHFPEAGTDVHINPELKRNLYLVMKEALNNVAKYSGAAEVSISLTLTDGAYRFCITDDGKGIEPGVVQGGGNGLGNMRRRMESVQGECAITSEPGKGTSICCSGQLT